MSFEAIVNAGALGLLVIFAAGVLRWLVKKINECESRCERLEDRLMGQEEGRRERG